MRQKDVRAVPEGYEVTFTPAKQTSHTITKKFLIPRNRSGEGVCHATVLDLYFSALAKDLGRKITPESPLFMTGRKPTAKGTSVYANIPLGVNEIKNTGKYMAQVLGKPDSDEYTGI